MSLLAILIGAAGLVQVQQQPQWSLSLGGDVMLNGVSSKTRPLAAVASFFRESNVAIVNLEIPMTSSGKATKAKSAAAVRAKTQFILRADPTHVGSLAGCQIDAVSLGNNHAMDYGAAGLKQMTDLLSAKGIAWAGAGQDLANAEKPATIEKRGLPRIRLVSYLAFRSARGWAACTPATAGKAGVAALRLPEIDAPGKSRIADIVVSAKADGDFLIVALHGGVERETQPNAYQVALARAFVDAGADLVVGHHPHVLQGGEIYKGRPILYSVGNLVSPRPGATALFRLRFSGRVFQSLEALPCRIAGGKTKPLGKKEAPAALQTWNNQCRAIRKTFPSENARTLVAIQKDR